MQKEKTKGLWTGTGLWKWGILFSRRPKTGNTEEGGLPEIPVKAVQTGARELFRFQSGERALFAPAPDPGEWHLYKALRDHVPIIDAAIGKIIRLAGGFQVECDSPADQGRLDEFSP